MTSESFPSSLERFHQQLLAWYEEEHRPLPWRETHDPYKIWLSEVILQQTRIDQGIGYYHRFLEAYPRVQALAEASEEAVLLLWQGLGYYSRARNLLKAARLVVAEHHGIFPQSYKELRRLPGIGAYTAAAIMSFAFREPYAAVDGNVYRVLSRLLFSEEPIDTTTGQRYYQQQADLLIDRAHPDLYNQAMIELGALICLPRKPRCTDCPLREFCLGYKFPEEVEQLPIKQAKIKLKERYFHYYLLLSPSGKILLRRRGAGDVWQGLWELPLLETKEVELSGELLPSSARELASELLALREQEPLATATLSHRLTHQKIEAKLYLYRVDRLPAWGEEVELDALPGYAISTLLGRLIAQVLDQS